MFSFFYTSSMYILILHYLGSVFQTPFQKEQGEGKEGWERCDYRPFLPLSLLLPSLEKTDRDT